MKIVSFNLLGQYFINRNFEKYYKKEINNLFFHDRLKKSVDAIKKINPDIICLQELSCMENARDLLKYYLGDQYLFIFETNQDIHLHNLRYGSVKIENVIVYKKDLKLIESRAVEHTHHYSPRRSIIAKFSDFIVICNHIKFIEDQKNHYQQVDQINQILDKVFDLTLPILWAGDFNISYPKLKELITQINQERQTRFKIAGKKPNQKYTVFIKEVFVNDKNIIQFDQFDFLIYQNFDIPEEYFYNSEENLKNTETQEELEMIRKRNLEIMVKTTIKFGSDHLPIGFKYSRTS